MSEWTAARPGGCRCGAVRFEVRARPLVTMACHCKGCQRMSGGPFSLSSMIAHEAFAVTTGTPVVGGAPGGPLHHFFCPACMSWLFTRAEGMDMVVNVRSTLLDDPDGTEPFIESWTSEKLPWAATPARHGFSGFPPAEAYAALMAAFAAQADGPG